MLPHPPCLDFWALLKRGLGGTYISVDPYHLQAYVVEQVYRFNNRATKENPMTDADRFVGLLWGLASQRNTFVHIATHLATSG